MSAVAHAADRQGLVFGVSALSIETHGGAKWPWRLKIAAQRRNIERCRAWLTTQPDDASKREWQRWIDHAAVRADEAERENETRAGRTAYRERSKAWEAKVARDVRTSRDIPSP